MTTATSRETLVQLYVERFIEEILNQGQADKMDALVTQDFVDHNPLPGCPPSAESVKRLVVGLHTAFPDLHFDVEDVIVEGDRVVGRWRMEATNTGSFMGIPPTGNHVAVTGIDIVRVADGKFAELWYNVDELGLMQQLGVVSPPS